MSTDRPHPDCFVFLKIFSCEGGIQSYVQDILGAYREQAAAHDRQADVFLLYDPPGCPNLLSSDRITYHALAMQPAILSRLRLGVALLTYLLRQRPQRVFCGHINLAPLVRGLCRPLGIPYTVLTYGKEVWQPLPASKRQALQQADQVWTISRYSAEQACQANDLNPDRVQLLPCVVDGERFTPGPKSPKLLQQYGLEGARVLMTVARLWSGDIYKGVDVTLRALPAIAQVFPEVKYLVIGRGDDQPRLAQLAQEMGVSDRVVFAGFVPTEQLVDHYRLADAYIMPSQEGFGIVYLEAMACGVPVLSGDGDGSADPLQDGRLGWRVPHRDPAAVAHACLEILKGDDQRSQGAWLRQAALTQFGKAALGDRLFHLLQSPPATGKGPKV